MSTTFPGPEFAERTRRAQDAMAKAGLAALLLTTEPEVRYFTGFLTRFWESPTRPWFVVVPSSGKPIAVIPAIGAALMSRGWVDDIRVAPDGRVGVPMGHETHVKMPMESYARVAASVDLVADGGLVRDLRLVKSVAEIARVRAACTIAGRAFARVPEIAREGVALAEVFQRFQMIALEEGADWVPYLAGGAGAFGYGMPIVR